MQWASTEQVYAQLPSPQPSTGQRAHGLPEEIRVPIEKSITPIPPVLQGILQESRNVWHIMGKARNNLAHGNIRQTDEQLGMLTRLGHTIAVGLVLRTFGVPPARLAAAIDRGDWPLL